MALTQKNRQIQVATPLAPDELLIYRMEAAEELGRLFEFTIDLLSENDSIALDDLLGQKMTVEMDLSGGRSAILTALSASSLRLGPSPISPTTARFCTPGSGFSPALRIAASISR